MDKQSYKKIVLLEGDKLDVTPKDRNDKMGEKMG